ncbi:MAG: ATP-binding protein [Stomatobaculum sp.]
MIKKLQKKFILINMIFVTTILLVIFVLLFSAYYRRVERDNGLFMDTVLNRTMLEKEARSIGGTDLPLSASPAEIEASELLPPHGAEETAPSPQGSLRDAAPDAAKSPQSASSDAPCAGKAAQSEAEADASDASSPAFPPQLSLSEMPRPRKNTNYSVPELLFKTVPGNRKNGGFLPYIIYRTDTDGNILDSDNRDLTAITGETLHDLTIDLLSDFDGGTKNGYLPTYDLRYQLRSAPDGHCLLMFADISYTRSSIRSFFLFCVLVLTFATLLFYVLSFFLSRWALAPVQKAWDQQNRFIADASHELKTPITVILANLDIIASHPEDPVQAQSRWIRNTKEEAERMRQLIQDLLFLAKSDASALEPLFGEVDLSDCAEDRALNFEAVAFEKDVRLFSEVLPGIRIIGNEGQLKQLITILLDNAVKYTGPGGRAVLKVTRSQDSAVISVSNTGEAIHPEELKHIFERFYRIDKSRARKVGGYGLGLSIARNIVSLHQGSIRCESDPTAGISFIVELPLRGKNR